jgi:hypothetical protein
VAGGQLAYTCTWPDPGGAGNLTNPPVFMDRPAGDYRLQAGSPGIDAGTDSLAVALDYAGVDRPLDGDLDGQAAYDLGAFEFVHPLADSDADGLRDRTSSRAAPIGAGDTDAIDGDGHEVFAAPTLRADSYLGCLRPAAAFPAEGGWVSVAQRLRRLYTLSRATNLVEALFSTVASISRAVSMPRTRSTAVGSVLPVSNRRTTARLNSMRPVIYPPMMRWRLWALPLGDDIHAGRRRKAARAKRRGRRGHSG